LSGDQAATALAEMSRKMRNRDAEASAITSGEGQVANRENSLKNEPNTARLSWVLANEEFLTVEIPRYALERFMVQAKRAIEEAPLSLGGIRAGSGHAECDEIT